jgi:hypothetical protein
MFLDTPTLDVAVKITHVIGLPAIVGAIVWLVRAYDSASRSNKEIAKGVQETQRIAMEVQGTMTTVRDNHLAHMAENINKLSDVQEKTVEVLQGVNTSLGILVDRTPRM